MTQLSITQIIINTALFIAVITYMSATKLAPITFIVFILPIIGLLVATDDLQDNYKAALVVSALSTLMLFGTLYNVKEINSLHNDERSRAIKDFFCLANPKCLHPVKAHAISTNEELIAKDPVAFVESNMAKLDIELNEYENVNLKALQTAAKENSEITDERIKFYKKYLTDVKTSNYKRNFIRLTLAANTFSLETCNKYNSTEFCAGLADLTIPQIEMSESIKWKRLEKTGRMNAEETRKYLDLVYEKLDKALDKRPDRVLTGREVNNIFESVPTKQQ